MKIFLSHSGHKKALVREVKRKLPEHMSAWIDEVELLIGEDIGRSISAAIKDSSDFVVIFIDSNAANSEWVQRELRWARQREIDLGREFILPVVIDHEAWLKVKPVVGERNYIECRDERETTIQVVADQLAATIWTYVARFWESIAKGDPRRDGYDFVANFWEPHIASNKATRILYPEPQFFRDDRHTYMRNQEAECRDRKEVFSYLGVNGGLAPSYSFVSSGVVRAMLLMIDCLHHYKTKVITRPLRPTTPFEESDENVIILGTPGMIDFISTLEAPYPFHTQTDGVKVQLSGNGTTKGLPEKLTDDIQENLNASSVHLVKWAVFTRRPHIHRDNITTVLAAPHGRSIEAIAGFLTRTAELSMLSQCLTGQDKFPRQMQVLFRVPMLKTEGEPHIEPVQVHKALNLDQGDKVARRRPTI